MRRGRPTPGQTPIDDLSGLKLRDLRTQRELNAAEAENIRKALVKYLTARPGRRLAPFDVRWALRLHAEMFGDVWAWAGKVRTRETNLGSAPRQIEVELHNLLEDLKAWDRSPMARIEQSARLHHGAVKIHPFVNGNGRWARLLANIWLKRNGHAPTEWPQQIVGAASVVRAEYLDAVRAGDRGNLRPLIALHERFTPPP